MTEQEIEESLKAVEVIVLKPLDSSALMNRRKGSYTDLLDGGQPLNISVKRNGRVFEFDEPIFIVSAFFTSTSDSAPSLEIKYKDIQAKEQIVDEENKIEDEKTLEAFISNAVKSISISPKGMVNFKENLSKVVLIGVKLSRLSEVVTQITITHEKLSELQAAINSAIKKSKADAQELIEKEKAFDQKVANSQQQIKADENKIAELAERIKSLEEEEEKSNSELSDLKHEVEGRENKVSDLDKREETVKNSISQLETKRNDLNVELAKAETRLKDLKNNINTYSENISDYIKEARKQSLIYTILLGIALWGLSKLGYELVVKINDLIDYYIGLNTITQGKTRAIDFLYLRAPMALVISFFVYLFANVIDKLVQKIIHINDVKKELIAASIIAREVVESSSHGLDMSSKEIYDLKEVLKLDFLTHTMFAKHVDATKEAKKRRMGFLESVKFKINDKLTGTSIEGGVNTDTTSGG